MCVACAARTACVHKKLALDVNMADEKGKEHEITHLVDQTHVDTRHAAPATWHPEG